MPYGTRIGRHQQFYDYGIPIVWAGRGTVLFAGQHGAAAVQYLSQLLDRRFHENFVARHKDYGLAFRIQKPVVAENLKYFYAGKLPGQGGHRLLSNERAFLWNNQIGNVSVLFSIADFNHRFFMRAQYPRGSEIQENRSGHSHRDTQDGKLEHGYRGDSVLNGQVAYDDIRGGAD